MQVLLVGNYEPDAQQSMQRFAALMHDQLQQRGHDVQMMRPMPIVNRRAAPPSGVAKWLGYADKFLLFPLALKRAARRADIVHICDHSNASYVSVLKGIPHLVTCHDVLAIQSALGQVAENPTGRSGKILQKLIVGGLNKAQKIVCDSYNTQSELLQVSSIEKEKTNVVYISLNYPFEPTPPAESRQILSTYNQRLAQALASNTGYLLHVGGNQWYKNRMGVLRIFHHFRRAVSSDQAPLLVMAGKEFTAEMESYIHEQGLGDQVISIQNCPPGVLQALYSAAELLLFPSLAEGFGWPVLEAQALRMPRRDFRQRAMTEVGASAAVYVNPHDEPHAARQIIEVLHESPSQKSARVETGFRNVARFSGEQMIQSYLEVYKGLARVRKSSAR